MCTMCNRKESLFPTGETYKENGVKYKEFVCCNCDEFHYELIKNNKIKVSKKRV